jgi:hypothetical protein
MIFAILLSFASRSSALDVRHVAGGMNAGVEASRAVDNWPVQTSEFFAASPRDRRYVVLPCAGHHLRKVC